MLTFSVFLLQNDNRLITLRWCAHQGSRLLKGTGGNHLELFMEFPKSRDF